MNGQFNVTLFDAGSYKDQDFVDAVREKSISKLLSELKVDLRLETQNTILHYVVPHIFQHLMSGPGAPSPFDNATYGNFICMCFMSKPEEPAFTESYTVYMGNYTQYVYYTSECINYPGAAKLLINDSCETYYLAKDSQGREAVIFRDRWLFLPSEVISSSIRSIGIYGNNFANATAINYAIWGRSARVRFKDPGGNPVTINKLGTQAMVVDYTFTLVSI